MFLAFVKLVTEEVPPSSSAKLFMGIFSSEGPTTRGQVSYTNNKCVEAGKNTMVGCFPTALRRSSQKKKENRKTMVLRREKTRKKLENEGKRVE